MLDLKPSSFWTRRLNGRTARIALTLAWALGLSVVSFAAYRVLPQAGAANHLDDLQTYLGSLHLLRDGKSLYAYHAVSTGDSFTYPPLAALVFLPLTAIPADVVDIGWTAATGCCVVLISYLMFREVSVFGERRASVAGVGLIIISLSAPVQSDLRFGQVSIFVACMVIADVLLLSESRFSGVLTGLAAGIKLTPLIFIPYLWLAGRRRATIVAISSFVVGVIVSWIALPSDSRHFWSSIILNGSGVHDFSSAGNASLLAALHRLGMREGPATVTWLVLGVAIAGMALKRAARADQDGSRLAALAIVGAAGVVVSPISWTHHQIWLVLAAAVPVAGPIGVRILWPAISLAVMLLPSGDIRTLLAVAVAAVIPFSLDKHEDEADSSASNERDRTIEAVT